MSRNRIALFGVLGVFLVGLALGIFGHGLIAPSEEQRLADQLTKEMKQREQRVKDERVAVSIELRLISATDSLSMFRLQHQREIDENYDISAVLDTPDHIREHLSEHFADGKWTFYGKGKSDWWVGYRLDDVSSADRKRLAERASLNDLRKALDGEAYDGREVVYVSVR